MDQDTIIAEIEARAKAADVSIAQLCDTAGVARSTFSRWKRSDRNPNPIGATIVSLSKLDKALAEVEARRAA
ncbi:MAG: helix-turn-helix domain-containing protein [Burkholderiaceae bacterium]